MLKKYLFAIILLLNALSVFSQEFGMGAVFDPELYAQVPLRATTRDVTPLPRAASVKGYAPYPGNQGETGTCTGWATAYAARTTSESVSLGRTDRTLTTNSAFSPIFVYRSISNDPTLRNGSAIPHALELIKNQGAPRRVSLEITARPSAEGLSNVTLSLFAANRTYPIKDYARLFYMERTAVRGWHSADHALKIRTVKKALSEGKPVVIGMHTPHSFYNTTSRWVPTEQPFNYDLNNYRGHAMVVVGYDDDIHGGAFEIQNSWGTSWGNEGYIWISYNDFANFVVEAYELIEDPMRYQNIAEFSGSVEIEMELPDQRMDVEFTGNGYYRTTTSHATGTGFRYIMNCDKPAYLYSFAINDHDPDSYYRIFPQDGVLAILDYRENNFAFPPDRPGEIDWLELYGPTGTEYLVVLFSKRPLDIDAIGQQFRSAQGNLVERVEQAVGQNFIRPHTASYERDRIAFTAQSPNEHAVFGLLLVIDHR